MQKYKFLLIGHGQLNKVFQAQVNFAGQLMTGLKKKTLFDTSQEKAKRKCPTWSDVTQTWLV